MSESAEPEIGEGYGVETVSGSVYVVIQGDGRYFLTANNVANAASEKMPGDMVVELETEPIPWPPVVGASWLLQYPSPKGLGLTRIKRTSAVQQVLLVA